MNEVGFLFYHLFLHRYQRLASAASPPTIDPSPPDPIGGSFEVLGRAPLTPDLSCRRPAPLRTRGQPTASRTCV